MSRILQASYRLGQPALFRLDAERAHQVTAAGLRLLDSLGHTKPRPPVCRVFGVDFPSRVGLAAGMDKDGVALRAWPRLGFGFIEVGTVTAHPQPGNPKPRLFRLKHDAAVINRMGFNNHGSAALAAKLKKLGPLSVPLGISIGKSKITPVSEATEDYLISLRRVYDFADYIAVNVSSPNTPGLRTLQDAGALTELVQALVATSGQLAASSGRVAPVPIAVKVAPDMEPTALAELVTVCLNNSIAAIIATNTTISREGITSGLSETGGLSGRPLHQKSLAVVRAISAQAAGEIPIIGVGGISCAADAQAMITAGASLVQVYSGLVYQGPQLITKISSVLDS